eukprot:GFUD01041584.1.p1 GENE.GFUD01041584.1~~GFUD01041584.1.p1  ORF type:complete len:472 (-),score=140.79 GFUD01041584.1:1218-2633(-)
MLTAKELVRAVKEVKDEQGGDSVQIGAKLVDWDGCYQDQEVLARVSAMVHPLRCPRVSIKSSLSEAVWCADTSRVVITKNSGRQELGPLLPEEALQLLENNALFLTRAGVPLSLQAGYTLLLSPTTGVSSTEYMVYSKLARAGYKVVRHQGSIKNVAMDGNQEEGVTDSDVDTSLLVPCYGVNLKNQPGREAPEWLQDIRDSLVPHLSSGEPPDWSQYGLNSWLKDIVVEMVDEVVELCQNRKRKSKCSVSDKPSKQARVELVSGSPKYEVTSSEDECSDYSRCARCARIHLGGEEGCMNRDKVCQMCGMEGHISNVHQVEEEGMRRKIGEVLGLSQWELWGRYAPEIVTIEEESEEEEKQHSLSEHISDSQEAAIEHDGGDNDISLNDEATIIAQESEVCEVNKLYINPFHDADESEDVAEDVLNDSSDSEELSDTLPSGSNPVHVIDIDDDDDVMMVFGMKFRRALVMT